MNEYSTPTLQADATMPDGSIGYRLSTQQEQVWEAARTRPRGRVSLVARIEPPIPGARLVAGLSREIEQHQILRTSFVTPPGARRPLQVIHVIDETAIDPHLCVANGIRVQHDVARDGAQRVVLSADPMNADAESLRLLLDAIVRRASGRASEEPAGPRFQYLNISEWQHGLIEQGDAREMLEWWRQRIDEVAFASRSGLFHPPSSAELAWIGWECPSALVDALAAMADVRHVWISDIVLSAWVVSRRLFTRSEDHPVAYRVTGRFTSELDEAIGPMGRFVPLLAKCPGDQDFGDLVAAIHAACEEASERQEYFHPPAVGREDPLVSGCVPAYAFLDRELHIADVDVRDVRVEQEDDPPPSCVPFALQCTRDGQSLHGRLWYDRSARLPDAASMLDAFRTCLESGVSHPDRRIRRMRGVSSTAAERVLADLGTWHDSHGEQPLVHECIATVAASDPPRIAVASRRRLLTYGELAARASRLAAALAAAGVRPEVPVGVLMRGCPEAIVAVMAVLEAGGTYVPLDSADPPARLERLLAGLDIRIVLVAAGDSLRIDTRSPIVISVNLDDPAAERRQAARRTVSSDNAAYVIHTSGSTGEAKPVVVSHGALRASTRERQRYYGEPVTRFLLVSPLTFDSSIAGLFWTLADGGTLIFPETVPPDPEELRATIAAQSVTHLLCIPRLLQAVADRAAAAELDSLRTAIVAGEPCPRTIAGEFSNLAPRCALYNEYGVTESAVWSTVHRFTDEDRDAVVPIGTAIAGTRLYVCSDDLELLPEGAVGELCIGGISLARGYAGQPGATAARFLPDPYSPAPGARLYRTGDLVRLLNTGALTFVGRADHQVKIRGQRVELEQLEAIVRHELPGCDIAVVCTPTPSPGLAAFYTPRTPGEVSPDRVRAALAARLPAGLVPSKVVECAALPRTTTGKLDRQALASSPLLAPRQCRSDPPRTELERTLAEIWAPLLGLQDVGREDDFFELGGDSIIGLQITSRARAKGVVMTPRQVLACRTIAALAAELETQVPGALPDGAAAGLLTPIQRWFFEQRFAEAHHYNQALLMDAAADLDLAALGRAVDAVVLAHAPLQTAFTEDERGWRAEHRPDVPSTGVHVIELGLVDTPARRGIVDRVIAEAQTSFALSVPPLFRVVVLCEAFQGPTRVLFVAHHLVIDGVSWRILLDDLADAYAAIREGRLPSLAPVPTSTDAFVHALAERAADPVARSAVHFWSQPVAAGVDLPIDYPNGANLEGTAADVSVVLGADRMRLLRQLGAAADQDAVLLTALGRALAEWCDRDTTWIDVERHGRDAGSLKVDLSRTVSWLTTVLPLPLTCSRSLQPLELVADVSAQLRRAPADAWLYGYLRYSSDASERALVAGVPQPRVGFNNLGRVRRSPASQLPLAFASMPEPLRSPTMQRTHVIDVTVTTVEDTPAMTITYSTALHARSTIERLGRRIVAVLDTMCDVAAA